MPKPGQFAPREIPPVTWTPERAARGASTSSGPRCTEPGCPVRYASGENRPCREHADEAEPAYPVRRHRPALPGARVLPGPARSWGIQAVTPPPGEHEDGEPEREPQQGTVIPPWVRYPGMRRPDGGA